MVSREQHKFDVAVSPKTARYSLIEVSRAENVGHISASLGSDERKLSDFYPVKLIDSTNVRCSYRSNFCFAVWTERGDRYLVDPPEPDTDRLRFGNDFQLTTIALDNH